jgi:hypothetical protein
MLIRRTRDLLKITAVRFSGLRRTGFTIDPVYEPLVYRCCLGRVNFTRNYHGCMRRRQGQSNDYWIHKLKKEKIDLAWIEEEKSRPVWSPRGSSGHCPSSGIFE